MFPQPSPCRRILQFMLAVMTLCGASGCGMLADPDRIVIAEMNGKPITRGKLFSIIYDMPDNKRPVIQSRQDYLRVLNAYIDHEIKVPLGQQLSEEGKINIPRDAAREAYFNSITDETERDTQRKMWDMPIAKPGEETELMRIYDIDAESIQFQKNIVEQGTDQFLERLLGNQAVTYLALQAYQAKELVLDEEILRLEYEITKENYKTLERLTFLGLQFPTAVPGASTEAAEVRKRISAGESFDAIFDEYIAKNVNFGIESVIENNPTLDRFRGFWQEASGAEVGEVRGPVYMPAYSRMKVDASGQAAQATVPECYLVFKVLEHEPETIKSFEEAVPLIAPTVAYAAMMERLREENGVVIYEDKFPNTGGGKSTMLQN